MRFFHRKNLMLFLALILAWGGPSILFAKDKPMATPPQPTKRFFLMGDGMLHFGKEDILFRDAQGEYLEPGLKRLHQIFGANWQPTEERLSLRFIEIIDYLQDQLGGGTYRLRSGYRSPRFNQRLRQKGKMAAQTSMHIEGAAGDLIMAGTPSGEIFEYVKTLNCCGIGWYGTKHFHVDSGPPRYWDQTNTGIKDKTPQENSKIILQASYDRYHPGETIDLQFMRVTNYPFGVCLNLNLVTMDEAKKEVAKLKLEIPNSSPTPHQTNAECPLITTRSVARQLNATLPKEKLAPGKYALRVFFCNRFNYEKMPESILSRPFEILGD